jgi:Poly A polymerase head domain
MEEMTTVEPDALDIPPCVTPRPGEAVIVYENGVRICGRLLGHDTEAQPCVEQASTGAVLCVPSFDLVRLERPRDRLGPNWEQLPETAKIIRPADKHAEILDGLLERSAEGVSPADLLFEVWSRGYEVFLIDRTVRDALAGREPLGVEVATTMPIARLHALVGRMYDAKGEFGKIDRLSGSLRIGRVPGSGHATVSARVFPLHGRGTDHARFASSFASDTGYRDFACHCVYYDPVNKVLIDPTGTGIDDALGHRLRMVYNKDLQSRAELGRIGLRAAVMLARGYQIAEDGEAAMAEMCAIAQGLSAPEVVHRLKRVIVEETVASERSDVLGSLYTVSSQVFGEQFAREHILGHAEEYGA